MKLETENTILTFVMLVVIVILVCGLLKIIGW